MSDEDDTGAGERTAPTSEADVAATYCSTLVDEWRRAGLAHAVISPGSRSTPLVLAAAEDPAIRVHVVHDERSAAFMALGIGIATGRPALLVCTSGTAAANLHPAVVEGHQAGVPMLVVTADRPPEMHGVGAPQTIDQRDLYRSAVRWYCEPGPPGAAAAATWRDLARDAWVRTLGATPGPVHLNLAFREPLLGVPGELPAEREPLPSAVPGASWGLVDEDLGRLIQAASARRGVLVAGARTALCDDDVTAVLSLASHLGWPVLADALSGCRIDHPNVVTTADQLLRHDGFADAATPEVVIRLGGLHASRALSEWLARSGALQFGIDRYGLVPDPDRNLGIRRPADPATVCRQVLGCDVGAAPNGWTSMWHGAEVDARSALDAAAGPVAEPTEPVAAIEALAAVPEGGVLVVSSSMPVRDLESFAPPRGGVRVVANRGANGIDGVTSTAVGVALSWVPTVLLTGDVAFLHDTNALLGLNRRGVSLTVVVVDNDGGGIFSFLPQASVLSGERFEQLFGTPHGTDVVAVAEAYGVAAERVTSRAGLRSSLNGSVSRGGVRVIAVRSDRGRNVEVHHALTAAVGRALDSADPDGPSSGDTRPDGGSAASGGNVTA